MTNRFTDGHHISCNYRIGSTKDCKFCKSLYKREKMEERKKKLNKIKENENN